MKNQAIARIFTIIVAAGSLIPSGVAGYKVLAQRDQEESVPQIPPTSPSPSVTIIEDSPAPTSSTPTVPTPSVTPASSSFPVASVGPINEREEEDHFEDELEDELEIEVEEEDEHDD